MSVTFVPIELENAATALHECRQLVPDATETSSVSHMYDFWVPITKIIKWILFMSIRSLIYFYFSTDECQDEEGKDTGICNNGICVDEVGSYQCFCRPGFSGHDCSQDIQECLSKPCQNNGTCIDKVASYICECQPGFKGNLFFILFFRAHHTLLKGGIM